MDDFPAMSEEKPPTLAGAEIVEALTKFYEALMQGPEAVARRFAIRVAEPEPGPRAHVGEQMSVDGDTLV